MTKARGERTLRVSDRYRKWFVVVSCAVVASVLFGVATAQTKEWIEIDYGALVDRRELSHSGESVGELLDRLGGRSLPAPGERPADRLAHTLLDPLLEPYGFVLQDALDGLSPVADPPLIEVGSLWSPGQSQPAWVELLRARHFLVESDGAGRMRICLPADRDGEDPQPASSAEAARRAYDRAWPVLRHVFAAEQRRLNVTGEAPVTLGVAVHPYVHSRASTRFLLGRVPLQIEVADTRSRGTRPPLDLDGFVAFLEAGLHPEGGRLAEDGSLRLFGSRPPTGASVPDRPLELADFAVAYRTIFHGGLAEPYMSLDRGFAPQTSIVNYGGRLRDTDLGMVSLLCDIRFKTFSLGIDIVTGQDVREGVRRELPGFMTHLERFSADPSSAGVHAQQTRLWFYPDRVDLTVSPQSDVLAMRRVRMSAASERLQGATMTAEAGDDPPWTRATVAAINSDYDALASFFPELADLDQVVRLLSLFTWLRQAEAIGLRVPELDALLAVELPQAYTPRRFPQLLTFDALPPPGGDGPVASFDRVPVGDALERLRPRGGRVLPARLRFERAVAALDAQNAQEAPLLEELSRIDPASLDDGTLDLHAYRAERLRMHRLVLSTLDRSRAEGLRSRQQTGEQLRIFSVGIGGLDLAMDQVLARASGQSMQIGFGASPVGRTIPARPQAADGARMNADEAPQVREEWREDPSRLPEVALPDHGPGSGTRGETYVVRFGDHYLERGVEQGVGADGRPVRRVWLSTVMGVHAPEVRSRKVYLGDSGRLTTVERVEGSRFLRYGYDREGDVLKAKVLAGAVVPDDVASAAVAPPAEGLVRLWVVPGASDNAPSERLRLEFLQGGTPRQLEADFPRQVLQRLVMGRSVDLTPAQPLPLAPLPPSLGQVTAVMFQLGPVDRARPWESSAAPVPGEEDPVRLATALNLWSRQGPPDMAAPPAVVGVDPGASADRWRDAPRALPSAVLLLPPDGFVGRSSELREALAAAWSVGPVVDALPDRLDAALVVTVSDEPPGLCASRLRDLAEQPAMEGKLLAAWCLAGGMRPDVPAGLVDGGRLAGLGVASSTLVDRRHTVEELAAFARALASPLNEGGRIELVEGPFLWFF